MDLNTDVFPGKIDDIREPIPDLGSKTALRLRYEAEKAVIQQQIGSLETIRRELGLSRRKICQLLLVDPSAWSRWTRSSQEAPPHIYRALHWYLLLQSKEPALNYRVWLAGVGQARRPEAITEWQRDVEKRQDHLESLVKENSGLVQELGELKSQLLRLSVPQRESWWSRVLWVTLGVALSAMAVGLARL